MSPEVMWWLCVSADQQDGDPEGDSQHYHHILLHQVDDSGGAGLQGASRAAWVIMVHLTVSQRWEESKSMGVLYRYKVKSDSCWDAQSSVQQSQPYRAVVTLWAALSTGGRGGTFGDVAATGYWEWIWGPVCLSVHKTTTLELGRKYK